MTGVLFKVASRLILTPAGAVPIIIDPTLGSGLHIEWSVEKSNTSSPDKARVVVYNLALETRKIIAELGALPGSIGVDLSIGWYGLAPVPAGPLETLFRGEDRELVAEQKTDVDWLTIIEAGSGYQAAFTPPEGGAEFGITIQLAVAKVLGMMGLTPSPVALGEIAAKAAKAPIPFQLSFEGDPRDILDDLMATIGLSWGIADGFFVVYTGGLRNDVLPSILTPLTGLLHWAEKDDGGVEFEALAQARVTPGVQVQIADELGVPVGGGPTRVERVTFEGTSDGPSIMRGTARRVQVF